MFTPPPFKATQMAKSILRAQQRRDGADMNALTGKSKWYCRPARFAGAMVFGPEPAMEFLFSAGRVTLATETGLVRGIFTDGRALPKDPDYSDAGTSVGQWQGNTLVVRTVGMKPGTWITLDDIELGEGASSTERFYQKSPDKLVVEAEIVAPAILVAPFKATFYFRREADHQYREFSYCDENDRAIDPASGAQRFDMTPPADLPPPPAG